MFKELSIEELKLVRGGNNHDGGTGGGPILPPGGPPVLDIIVTVPSGTGIDNVPDIVPVTFTVYQGF